MYRKKQYKNGEVVSWEQGMRGEDNGNERSSERGEGGGGREK